MEGKEKQGRTFLLKENRLLFHATGEIKSWSTVEQSPVDLSNAILIDHRLGPSIEKLMALAAVESFIYLFLFCVCVCVLYNQVIFTSFSCPPFSVILFRVSTAKSIRSNNK